MGTPEQLGPTPATTPVTPPAPPRDESHHVAQIPATASVWADLIIPGRTPPQPLEIRPIPHNVFALKIALKEMSPNDLKNWDAHNLLVYHSLAKPGPDEIPLGTHDQLTDGQHYWIVAPPDPSAPESKDGVPYTYCKACKEEGHPGKKIADHSAEASTDVMERIAKLELQVEASRLFDRFDWTEDHYTRQRSAVFVNNVLHFYNALDNCRPGERWCLVLGQKLYNVSVSHLFKHEWHDSIAVVGLDSIDDVRNGLPMFKPIEWAFDTSRLCFYIPEGAQKLTVKLLDKSIANLRLYQKGMELCGPQWDSRQPSMLSSMTFQQLDGRHLTFDDRGTFALNRPYKRILCLHAKAASRHAIRKGWMKDGEWQFPDFFSEGLSVSEKIRAWK